MIYLFMDMTMNYESKIFYVADFTFNNGKYQYETILFSEMAEAYASAVSVGKIF